MLTVVLDHIFHGGWFKRSSVDRHTPATWAEPDLGLTPSDEDLQLIPWISATLPLPLVRAQVGHQEGLFFRGGILKDRKWKVFDVSDVWAMIFILLCSSVCDSYHTLSLVLTPCLHRMHATWHRLITPIIAIRIFYMTITRWAMLHYATTLVDGHLFLF